MSKTSPNTALRPYSEPQDLICYSHLRWDSVFQRPHHLLTRAAQLYRVIFIEEPIASDEPGFSVRYSRQGVWVAKPRLSPDLTGEAATDELRFQLTEFADRYSIRPHLAWYYTPLALLFSDHLLSDLIVYDCMDELSAFSGAPPELCECEEKLLQHADLVFTGGASLFRAKRERHPDVYCLPSSIDRQHFGRARVPCPDPADQTGIPHPRIGFFGVIDERIDLDLLKQCAEAKPSWHFIMIGPVTKISESSLPMTANIHYLGPKQYGALPEYLANWDVAMLPFARNRSTEFISPTKTPEYLAGGVPVVSTPIRDVVDPYGIRNLVWVADGFARFIECAERALQQRSDERWRRRVDAFLAPMSWDATWARMHTLIQKQLTYGARSTEEATAGATR